jgi:hypothetical protein
MRDHLGWKQNKAQTIKIERETAAVANETIGRACRPARTAVGIIR